MWFHVDWIPDNSDSATRFTVNTGHRDWGKSFPLLACNSSCANLTQDAPTAFLLWPAHYICGFSFRSCCSRLISCNTRFCGCLILAIAMCPVLHLLYLSSLSLCYMLNHADQLYRLSLAFIFRLFFFSLCGSVCSAFLHWTMESFCLFRRGRGGDSTLC